MRREILMPPVTPSMVDGKVARWFVAEGQSVAAGDVLAEIATATATLEIEAADGGRVERILVPAGTEGVKVNTPIAIVFAEAERLGLAQAHAFASLDPLPAAPSDLRVTTGARGSQSRTYREALREAIASEMAADRDVFLIGVDVTQNRGAQKVAQGLHDEFGSRRVISLPALDEGAFGLAVGAAMAGLKPIVEVASWARALEVMLPYLTEAADAFTLSGGRVPVPIVFRGPNGHSPGATGHDARCVAGLLAQIPGLVVAHPSTPAAAGDLMSAAIRHGGPVCVLEHELLYATRSPAGAFEGAVTRLGRARTLRPGADVTVAASGHAVILALEAAARLERDGIDAEVIDLMCVRPLDVESVAASVGKTGRLVTVEEGWGIGAEVAAGVVSRCFGSLKTAPLRLAGAGVTMPYAPELQALALPSIDSIAREVRIAVRSSTG